MRRFGPLRASGEWIANNLPLHMLGPLGLRPVRLRYEDLVEAPHEQLERICGPGTVEFVEHHRVALSTHHTVAGNPQRFATGSLPLRCDCEWMERMPRRSRALVSAVSWPFLWRYGYLGAARK
jgi:hypothetical protein